MLKRTIAGIVALFTATSALGAALPAAAADGSPLCTPLVEVVGTQTVVTFTDVGACDYTLPSFVKNFEVVVIGAGAGGGADGGSGGGGGGIVTAKRVVLRGERYLTVEVGAGGAGGVGQTQPTAGGKSTIRSVGSFAVTSIGDGGQPGRNGVNRTIGGAGGTGSGGETSYVGGAGGRGTAGISTVGSAGVGGPAVVTPIGNFVLSGGGGGGVYPASSSTRVLNGPKGGAGGGGDGASASGKLVTVQAASGSEAGAGGGGGGANGSTASRRTPGGSGHDGGVIVFYSATPDAPTGLQVSANDLGDAFLSWSQPDMKGQEFDSYSVYYSLDAGITWYIKEEGIFPEWLTKATIPNLKTNTVYMFAVSAKTKAGEGPRSSPVDFELTTASPTLSGVVTVGGRSSLSWTIGSGLPDFDGFLIESRLPGKAWTPIATVGGADRGYISEPQTLATPVEWRVTSTFESRPGGISNTVVLAATVPGSPINPRISDSSITTLTITAEDPTPDGSPPVTGFTATCRENVAPRTVFLPEGPNPFKWWVTIWPHEVTTPVGETRSVVVPGLKTNSKYMCSVRAENIVGVGTPSAEVAGLTVDAPSAPRELAVRILDSGQLMATWKLPLDAGGGNIKQQDVYVSADNKNWVRNSTASGTATSIQLDTLTSKTTYYVKMTATNNGGKISPDSNTVTLFTPSTPGVPQAITGKAGDKAVTVNWSAPDDTGGLAVTGYDIELSSNGAYWWTTGNVNKDTYTFTRDWGLTNGITYYLRVKAKNILGSSKASEVVEIKPVGIPAAPRALSTQRGDKSATITWEAPLDTGGAEITGYSVLRTDPQTGWAVVGETQGELTFTDSALTNGIQYEYRLQAKNEVGSGPVSATVSVTPAGVPFAPVNLTASRGNSQALLEWDASVANGSPVTSYTVEESTDGVFFYGVGSTTTLKFTATGLTNGKPYSYRVSADNTAGKGLSTAPVAVTPATRPDAPVAKEAQALTPNTIRIVVEPRGDGGDAITSLNATCVRKTFFGLVTLETLKGKSSSDTLITVNGLDPGKTYQCSVVATNTVGSSSSSNTIEAKTPSVIRKPTAPQNPTVAPGDTTLTLAWTAPTDDGGGAITSYTVEISEDQKAWSTVGTTDGLATTFKINSLENLKTYYLRVGAANTAGNGPTSIVVNGTPVTEPSAPRDLQATTGAKKVNLTWHLPATDGGSPLTKQDIYMSTNQSTWGQPAMTVTGTATTATITGLQDGTTYYFKITASNSSNMPGPDSNTATATTPTVPEVPKSPVATSADKAITITWTSAPDGGSPITGYIVERSLTADRGWSKIGEVAASDPSEYTDSGLTNGTRYYYRVKAVNAVGISEASAVRSSIPEKVAVPSAPRDLTAAPANLSANLAWSAPTSAGESPIEKYIIETSIDQASWTVVGEESGTTFTHVVSNLENGTTYYFRVTAVNSAGKGPASRSVNVTPASVPSAPTSLTALAGGNLVTLTWQAPDDTGGVPLTGYFVERLEAGVWNVVNTTTETTSTVVGLDAGREYSFRVKANNIMGESPASNVASATPFEAPGAPTAVSAALADLTSIKVAFEPTTDGGSPLAKFTATCVSSDGGKVGSTESTNPSDRYITVNNLSTSNTYTCTVTATNQAGGTSAPSLPSNSVTLVTVPSAPTGLAATAGDGAITYTWQAPSITGGLPITIYTVTYVGGGVTATTQTTQTSTLVSGLVNGVSYTATVTATNEAGDSASSNSATATPQSFPAPTGLTASAQGNSVSATWGAVPNSTYQVFVCTGAACDPAASNPVSAATTSYQFTGAYSTTYRIGVKAVSGGSTSPMSNLATVTTGSQPPPPVNPPSAPLNAQAQAGFDQVATINWSTPASAGSSPITGYTVFTNNNVQVCQTNASTLTCNAPLSAGGYSFTVTATNSAGISPKSAASNSITLAAYSISSSGKFITASILELTGTTTGIAPGTKVNAFVSLDKGSFVLSETATVKSNGSFAWKRFYTGGVKFTEVYFEYDSPRSGRVTGNTTSRYIPFISIGGKIEYPANASPYISVSGTTSGGLYGKTVTPYYSFDGGSFIAGTPVPVDSIGRWAWQRNIGKGTKNVSVYMQGELDKGPLLSITWYSNVTLATDTELTTEMLDGQIVLTWKHDPIVDANVTRNQYTIDGGATWVTIESEADTHTVTGLQNGTAYLVQVRGLDLNGETVAHSPAITVNPPIGLSP